jgi:hypothetical protein
MQTAICIRYVHPAPGAISSSNTDDMPQVRAAVEAATVNPQVLTAAEELQYEGYLWREDTNAAVLALHKSGKPIKEVVRCTGHGRGTVRCILRG